MANLLPPYVSTYSTRTPYVTVAEYLNTPTGVDTQELIPSGSSLTETQTLTNMLLRASGWADSLCNQKLCATVDTRVGRFLLRSDSTIRVPLPYWPVVNVVSVAVGWTPSSVTTSVVDLTNAWPDSSGVLTVPITGAPTLTGNPPQYTTNYLGDDVYAVVTYVNGWANTGLTGAAASGATSLPVSNALGIAPGQQLAVYSQTAGEVVTVASTFAALNAPGPASVPIVGTLANAYAAGDVVTAMPQEIKQAVILLTSVLIKTRGAEAWAMHSVDTMPEDVEKSGPNALSDFDEAMDLLTAYRRIGY